MRTSRTTKGTPGEKDRGRVGHEQGYEHDTSLDVRVRRREGSDIADSITSLILGWTTRRPRPDSSKSPGKRRPGKRKARPSGPGFESGAEQKALAKRLQDPILGRPDPAGLARKDRSRGIRDERVLLQGPRKDESYGVWADRKAGIVLVVVIAIAILGSAILQSG